MVIRLTSNLRQSWDDPPSAPNQEKGVTYMKQQRKYRDQWTTAPEINIEPENFLLGNHPFFQVNQALNFGNSVKVKKSMQRNNQNATCKSKSDEVYSCLAKTWILC